jgi:membrane fusion protein (multidrug efflux system)
MSTTQRLIALVVAGLLCVAAILAANWWLVGRWNVKTDNAYVRADISIVSPQIEGYIRAIHAADNQLVKAGDPLIEIDPADYQARAAAARAALARAQAQYTANQAARERAAADLDRYVPLVKRGFFSPAGMDAIRATAAQAAGGAQAAAADIQAAKAQLVAANLDLGRTLIRAPISGVVGNRVAQEGQLVRPGLQLLSIVPLDDVYVIANFKETQLTQVRPGQPVTLSVDAYPQLKLMGVVDSLAPASGAQFSILPTDTATGNFTKIVQRVPVKVRLNMTEEARGLLRPGLSVVAVVDTHPSKSQQKAPALAAR